MQAMGRAITNCLGKKVKGYKHEGRSFQIMVEEAKDASYVVTYTFLIQVFGSLYIRKLLSITSEALSSEAFTFRSLYHGKIWSSLGDLKEQGYLPKVLGLLRNLSSFRRPFTSGR
ncbi:hypothetical protein E3N88_09488 [Mikania micrantha]|uniref:Uncharacterized protein n=1 Tax=Mikania micrantha TaxID=192012 RepID=A0A5N6PJW2_9ASTR|nr:hypothetical protein E3N88_09488 [Mikania micrantha]